MNLPDRMNHYETAHRNHLVRRMPVIIRVDGRSFHTLLASSDRPFDRKFIDSMRITAQVAMDDIQGCKLAYVQSDEISFLLTDYDTLDAEPWFGYVLEKVVSISAAMVSTIFSRTYGQDGIFDSRAFNVPREDVSNYFLWRAHDWARNSLHTYTRHFFSHKELHDKNGSDMHEMLHSVGKNWTTDLRSDELNGTIVIKGGMCIYPHPVFWCVDSIIRSRIQELEEV